MLTLGEAARQCGVVKGTISKGIKTGKLSATRREDGSWSIDNAELARYLDANGHRFRSETGNADQPEIAPATYPATDSLVAELRGVIADLRADRDAWREQAQRLTLPAPKPVEQPPLTPNATAKRPPWWKRLGGLNGKRAASRRPGPLRRPRPATSSATPTVKRSHTSTMSRSRGGVRRRTCSPAMRRGVSP